MIRRDLYLNQLFDYIDKPFIKVITGIRRSGKSVIMMMLRDELLKRGIKEKNIIAINFESFGFSDIKEAALLYEYIRMRIPRKQRCYILIDEIQEVDEWEKAVNSLIVDFDADVYLSGSNSRMLSSDLATYLAGRYIEIQVQTLSFSEYLLFRQNLTGKATTEMYREFGLFLRLGGFPAIHTSEYSYETAYKAVYDIYSSALLRDIVQRHRIRDVELLERVVRYVFDNIGNNFSAKKVADYFKSQQRRIDLNTVYNYLEALEGAFIVYRIPRYDIKGKEILKTQEKYFLADQSLLYAVMGQRDSQIAGVLENIVMLELKRRGYRVFTGRSDENEIDFIAGRKENKVYVQVAYLLAEQATIDREYNPLLKIRDHHPKYVVTMDENRNDNTEGIRHRHIADFLLMKEY
jgi:predicted AAA+ superfamily ATPase